MTAVVISIDRHGYLLWSQLPGLGVGVPTDVSLVGIGGIRRAEGLPQLTTCRCDYEAMAGTALDALTARHAGGRSADLYQEMSSVEMSSVFVAGESSAPPRTGRA